MSRSVTRFAWLFSLIVVLLGIVTPSSQAQSTIITLPAGTTRVECANGMPIFSGQADATGVAHYCPPLAATATPTATALPSPTATLTPSPTDVPPTPSPTATGSPTATAPPIAAPLPVLSVQIGAFTDTISDGTAASSIAPRLSWHAGNFSTKPLSLRAALDQSGYRGEHATYILALENQNPTQANWAPWPNQLAYRATDWAILNSHEDWFLHKKNPEGSFSRIAHGNGMYAMDPGSLGYRAWAVAQIKAIRQAGKIGSGGILWDNVPLNDILERRTAYGRDGMAGKLIYSGTNQAYSSEQFVAQSVQYLLVLHQAAGMDLPTWGNMVDGVSNGTEMQPYFTSGALTGAFLEHFATGFIGYDKSANQHAGDLRQVEWLLANGFRVALHSQGERTDTNRQAFALASYLLIVPTDNPPGRATFRYTKADRYGEWWWYDNYNIRCGRPLGPRTQPATQWQVREFEFCTVKVDHVNRLGYITPHP